MGNRNDRFIYRMRRITLEIPRPASSGLGMTFSIRGGGGKSSDSEISYIKMQKQSESLLFPHPLLDPIVIPSEARDLPHSI